MGCYPILRRQIVKQYTSEHCVKSAPIWSYSGPYFPIFGLNKER